MKILALAAAAAIVAGPSLAQSYIDPAPRFPSNVSVPQRTPSTNDPSRYEGSGTTTDDVMTQGGSLRTSQGKPSSSAQQAPYVLPEVRNDSTEQVLRYEASGYGRVVDGGILVVDHRPFVLEGIVKLSATDTCTDLRGLQWACGTGATRRLLSLVGRSIVHCEGTGNELTGVAGRCRLGNVDLARTMVLDGFAKSAGGTYEREEQDARSNRRGIWAAGGALGG